MDHRVPHIQQSVDSGDHAAAIRLSQQGTPSLPLSFVVLDEMPRDDPLRQTLTVNCARYMLAAKRFSDVVHFCFADKRADLFGQLSRELAYAYYRMGRPAKATRILKRSSQFRDRDEVAVQLYGQIVPVPIQFICRCLPGIGHKRPDST